MQIHPRLYKKMNAGIQTRFPVILYYRRDAAEIRQYISRRHGRIKYHLPFINAMAMELPAETIADISKERMVQWITDDAAVSKVAANHGSAPTGKSFEAAGEIRTAAGKTAADPWLVDSYFDPFTGFYGSVQRGGLGGRRRAVPVAAAVIDTGVALHQDLLFPVIRLRAFYDLIGHKSEPYDDDGHGTHISGILCGLSGDPDHRAVFPAGPALVAVKALDHQGNGNASDILAAMQWVLNNSRYYNIRTVNLSLGVTAEEEYDNDPLVRGVEALTRYGLTVVAAAGNSGPEPETISSPGICQNAITVGAAEGDHVASFSSRGPTPRGLIKPDLVAPGVNILSLDAKDPTGYIAQSGTSMAAPFVSRAACSLYARFPGIDPLSLKRLLFRSLVLLPKEPPEAQGHGLLLE